MVHLGLPGILEKKVPLGPLDRQDLEANEVEEAQMGIEETQDFPVKLVKLDQLVSLEKKEEQADLESLETL